MFFPSMSRMRSWKKIPNHISIYILFIYKCPAVLKISQEISPFDRLGRFWLANLPNQHFSTPRRVGWRWSPHLQNRKKNGDWTTMGPHSWLSWCTYLQSLGFVLDISIVYGSINDNMTIFFREPPRNLWLWRIPLNMGLSWGFHKWGYPKIDGL